MGPARLREANPPIWRRLLIQRERTNADLQVIFRIAFHGTECDVRDVLIRGQTHGSGLARRTVTRLALA